MSCKEVAEHAEDLLAQNLSWPEKARTQLHLLLCNHCQSYVEHTRATLNILRSLSPPPTPMAPASRSALLEEFRKTYS